MTKPLPLRGLAAVLLLVSAGFLQAAESTVANVRATQNDWTREVLINYDLSLTGAAGTHVTLQVSSDGGGTWNVPASSLSGNGIGGGVTPGKGKLIVWKAMADWPGQISPQTRFKVTATLSLNEILRFCARVVRTPVASLDPRNPKHPDGDLVKSYAVNESEASTSFRLDKHDPYKAIDTHLKLTGHDSETNYFCELAEALSSLSTSSPVGGETM